MGPDCNFCQLTLFWPHVLKMEILIDGFAATACRAGDITITGHGSMMTPAQLVIAARVASIIIVVALMTGMRAFVLVVSVRFAGLIARVPPALLVRMPSMLTMHMAGLKTLVLVRGGNLLLTRIVGASLAVAMLIIIASTTSINVLHAA